MPCHGRGEIPRGSVIGPCSRIPDLWATATLPVLCPLFVLGVKRGAILIDRRDFRARWEVKKIAFPPRAKPKDTASLSISLVGEKAK